MVRPVRVVERFAADTDEVGLAVLQDVLGMTGFEDKADRHRLDAGLAPDPFRIRYLEPRLARDARRRRRAADAPRRAVDHIYVARPEFLRQHHRVVERPAAVDPVDRRYP